MVSATRVIDVLLRDNARIWLLGKKVVATVDGARYQLPVVNADGTWALVPPKTTSISVVERPTALCGRRCINTITAPTSKTNGAHLASGCTCCRPRDWPVLPKDWIQ